MAAALIGDAPRAARHFTGVDVFTAEHTVAFACASGKTSAPVILQVSRSTVSYHGGALRPLAAALRAIAGAATVPVALHLYLVNTAELMRHGAAVGFSSIELDVHCLSYEERIAKVSRAARWLSANYVFAEAGLGPSTIGTPAPQTGMSPTRRRSSRPISWHEPTLTRSMSQ